MAGAALGALVFVPLQIAAADQTTREQSARDIYREFLNISIQRPELAAQDICALTSGREQAAYEAYVEYLLYTAEQVLDLNPADWEATIAARLDVHRPYLCQFTPDDLAAMTAPVTAMIGQLRAHCASIPPCTGRAP
jgi:hypothetical protein